MPNINPVDLQTLGARVTDPAQLTEGRWYAVRVNCKAAHNPLVHAKYKGMVDRSLHEFEVCDEDYETFKNTLSLAKYIRRVSSSIRTGKLPLGGVCEVFKFKQVKDEPVSIPQKSPYEYSEYATCARYGIKVGDKFKVINADRHGGVAVGDIVTMTKDDGSTVPHFVNKSTGKTICICLYRLVPVVANQSNTSAPAVTLSPIDQIKSEIDALNAQKQIKQEEIDKLTKDVATIGGEVDKLKQKVADSLKDYLPEPKKARLVDWPIISEQRAVEWIQQYHSQREELTPVHLDDLIKRIDHEIHTLYATNYGSGVRPCDRAESNSVLGQLNTLRNHYIHLRGQLRWEAQRRVLRSIRPI